MSSTRADMERELKSSVIPWLREAGFTGTFPHFRRPGQSAIDLLTFQFDRHGGAYFIEIAQCPPEGIIPPLRKAVSAKEAKAWDVNPLRRRRICVETTPGTDGWFRFDSQPPKQLAALTIEKLSDPSIWTQLCPIGPIDKLHLPP